MERVGSCVGRRFVAGGLFVDVCVCVKPGCGFVLCIVLWNVVECCERLWNVVENFLNVVKCVHMRVCGVCFIKLRDVEECCDIEMCVCVVCSRGCLRSVECPGMS